MPTASFQPHHGPLAGLLRVTSYCCKELHTVAMTARTLAKESLRQAVNASMHKATHTLTWGKGSHCSYAWAAPQGAPVHGAPQHSLVHATAALLKLPNGPLPTLKSYRFDCSCSACDEAALHAHGSLTKQAQVSVAIHPTGLKLAPVVQGSWYTAAGEELPSKIKMGCMQITQWRFAGDETHPCQVASASVASTCWLRAATAVQQEGSMHAMTEAVCDLPSPHMQATQLLRYP